MSILSSFCFLLLQQCSQEHTSEDIFGHMSKYMCRINSVKFLGEKVCTFLILTDIAQLSSRDVCPGPFYH